MLKGFVGGRSNPPNRYPGPVKRVAISLMLVAVVVVESVSAAPVVNTERIGRSVRDKRLRAFNIGARSSPKRILVVGCIHGNECAGKAVLAKLRRMPRPKNYELWLIWSLNPDGEARSTRHNARGVDLNRNFPAGWRSYGDRWDTYYPGPRPHSEPETRAAMRFVKEHRPDVTIWYHQAMELVTRRKRHNRVPKLYARLVGLPLRRLPRYPGTSSRWQNKRFPGHVSFVVELPAGTMSNEAARRHARAVRAVARAW
jgi:murein peptide amidase A